jgi:hypothetical protein
MSQRLPRFKRANIVPAVNITERDCAIIRLVHEHRFLRSSHIVALVEGSSQQVVRRLQLLYHHGYLERPRAQLDYYHRGGSRQIAHGLGNKGAALLKQRFGIQFQHLRWGEKNRAVGRMFLEHALLVSDVMVALELACRESDHVRLITGEELHLQNGHTLRHKPFQWKIVLERRKLGVIPDRAFALELETANAERERRFFFLEADRGTMPVIRKHLSQTSFHRKLLAYEATWSQSVLERRFDISRFQVITVTTSETRVDSLTNACSQLKRGKGLFLFAHRDVLNSAGLLFSPLWQSGKGGKPESLLSQPTCQKRKVPRLQDPLDSKLGCPLDAV